MLPSVVAAEITAAVRDFLVSGFEPSNPAMSRVVSTFLEEPGNVLKGPYLSVALPFEHARGTDEPFPEVPLGFTPYRHQHTAFSRLATDVGRSTVVATGTGSGKTECFLYPVLDHCRQQIGKRGIKAILIYPMNALAVDQARRIAGVIHRTESLRSKVTAGLYVGEREKAPHITMGGDHVITDRETLREHPPDILLTNYKMLDYLMIRPSDQRLWRHNEADTLRYLVVDELHTFDGAQGTDLACLIRRLRARLKTPRDRLVCVGTSATIGDMDDESRIGDLRKYVEEVFGQPFDGNFIVGEVRQSIDDFLSGALLQRHLLPRDDLASQIDFSRYHTSRDYLKAQYEVFFDDEPPPEFGEDSEDAEWRMELAESLRQHTTFVNLLRKLKGRPQPLSDIVGELRATLPVRSNGEAVGLLNGLCALISAARLRTEGGLHQATKPFLQIGMHLWVRELRRMVCSLCEPNESVPGDALERDGEVAHQDEAESSQNGYAHEHGPHRLRFFDDLKPRQDFNASGQAIHLPLVQCRECRITGWGCVHDADNSIDQDLSFFYNRFFRRDVSVKMLFPVARPAGVAGDELSICGTCGYVHPDREPPSECRGCRSRLLVSVFCPDSAKGSELSRDCAFCGANAGLLILGARASGLLSVAVGQIFGSHHNDDRKAIIFSDNVQDAAHRAGFLAARTWSNGMRAAITQTVKEHEGISLADLPNRVVDWWSNPEVNPQAFEPKRFVSEFIAPDRVWLRGYRELQEHGSLGAGSDIQDLVGKRIRWDTLAELGFRSAIGRTPERARAVAMGVDQEVLEGACRRVHLRLSEEIEGLRDLEVEKARAFVLGILRHMKDRGAIQNEFTDGYIRTGGNPFASLSGNLALPEYGLNSPLPVFPWEGPLHRRSLGLEPIAPGRKAKSWYQKWAEVVFTSTFALVGGDALNIVRIALKALEDELLVRYPARDGEAQAWALNPSCFYVTTDVAVMRGSNDSGQMLVVPRKEVDLWRDVPYVNLVAGGSYGDGDEAVPTHFGRLYGEAAIHRIVTAEHTALIKRDEREQLQERFADPDAEPWEPNVISATPTLELGIDIGSLSTVALASVPPTPENYLQRIGRAGRKDGNSVTVTVARGQSHDLYFYAEPLSMLSSRVDPPGVFLGAQAVLMRQLTAFCFDQWIAHGGVPEDAVPDSIRTILSNVEKGKLDGFPYPFFDFVQRQSDDLLDTFFAVFGNYLTDEVRESLTKFLCGGIDDEASLAYRMLERLFELVNDRKSIRADIRSLRARIRKLEEGPEDEASKEEKRELIRERNILQAVARELVKHNTYQFFTDEGLIPNYAFPEEGVKLRSVILRRGGLQGSDAPQEGANDEEPIILEYERPAVAALSEFAPENEFYAGGRHVTVERIDTRTSEVSHASAVERWRLCPSCAYCENLEHEKGDDAVCPKCGHPGWSDAGQCHEMLRLRLVHSVTPDSRSRIMDEKDDREPLYYTRHIAVDFEPSNVGEAYAIKDRGISFGCEYIASATFREINFGRRDEEGEQTEFAGRQMPRKGFRICKSCGTVQSSNARPSHTYSCSAARSDHAIINSLYLYREFDSEAIRMLVPFAEVLGSDERSISFMAAVELGLREQFHGRVDHIRAMTCENALAGREDGYRYMMIYDTVPGGTGYLKNLMVKPQNMLDVLQSALDALKACVCNQDPDRDGCYRCVYTYRRGRDTQHASRSAAVDVLESILEHADSFETVAGGLNEIDTDILLESQLEVRFIEALRRMEINRRKPQIRRDIVRGKPGYVLKVDGKSYLVEPQVDLTDANNVAVPSRPDFLIHPTRDDTPTPPIAVFMDGFEYHRKITSDDSLKRMALVRAGYLVWSLTWHDLELAFGRQPIAQDFLGFDENEMRNLQMILDGEWDVMDTRSCLHEGSLMLLLRYLRKPDPEHWKRAVFTQLFGLFDRERMEDDEFHKQFHAATAQSLPEQIREEIEDMSRPIFLTERGRWTDEHKFVDRYFALSQKGITEKDPSQLTVAIHLHDDSVDGDDRDNYRRAWNGVLRFFNLVQFLPSAWWTTKVGVTRDIYPRFGVGGAEQGQPSPPDHDEWADVMGLVVPELQDILRQLQEANAPIPEVGYELADDRGSVRAEAEIAWLTQKVAVLVSGQKDYAAIFADAGWQVFSADEENLVEVVLQALAGEA